MVDKKKVEKVAASKTAKDNTKKIIAERDIAADFAGKAYKEFDQMIKSIVLFGSSSKKSSTPDSDIDVILIIDDVSIKWDSELIAHYRQRIGELVKENPYRKALHITTVKLSTWWDDLMKGDPVVVNVLRYGDPLIDHGGFFVPMQVLLKNGKIRSTPESIYTLLQRAPAHLARARGALLAAIDGLYWVVVDSSHAALIAKKIMPPSPEHIPEILEEEFVKTKMLSKKHLATYIDLHDLAKEIVHGKTTHVEGDYIEDLAKRAEEFLVEMAKLVDKLIEK